MLMSSIVAPFPCNRLHDCLKMAGVSREPIPDDLMLQVFRRLSEVITKSYTDGQIEELDCLAIYDDAFRHLGYHLDREGRLDDLVAA